MATTFNNPFRPGAGHYPPHLAGREEEKIEFGKLLNQDTVLSNLVLTGLRGLGKTVLLDTFKPMAIDKGWLWVGTDLSESSSVTEESLAIRLMTDMAVVTTGMITHTETRPGAGFISGERTVVHTLDYAALHRLWEATPGLASDKLKRILETTWEALKPLDKHGIIFAYDEAQNLADHADKEEYPLSLLLDVFQSIQRKGIPFMLVLTGLPTLFPKLVVARTFAERMFHVLTLDRLSDADSKEAIVKPIKDDQCPIKFTDESVEVVYSITHGYPYFIQYVCRDVYDIWVQQNREGIAYTPIPVDGIMRKLDTDFFSGRWARATDRQRDLLTAIAHLRNSNGEFGVSEIVSQSSSMEKPFKSSQVSQMLASLSDAGLVYRNRWGKYSLAVPLLDGFIRRRLEGQASSVK